MYNLAIEIFYLSYFRSLCAVPVARQTMGLILMVPTNMDTGSIGH
jgi:hypothetical protein